MIVGKGVEENSVSGSARNDFLVFFLGPFVTGNMCLLFLFNPPPPKLRISSVEHFLIFGSRWQEFCTTVLVPFSSFHFTLHELFVQFNFLVLCAFTLISESSVFFQFFVVASRSC